MTSPTTDRRLGLRGGTAIKAPVDCATTANITLSGEQTIDGVTTNSSRVLVKNQTNGVQNGIYRSSTGTWTREPDANGTYDLVCGTLVGIAGGAQAFSIYQITTTGTITPDTTSITFTVALTTQAVSAYMQTLLAAANAAAARTLLGVAPRATRTDVASATTTDITTNAPNTDDIRLTGTATITSFTIATDRVLRVIANGAFTLTNNSNIVTNTGNNITAAVGDTFILRATAANTVEVLNYVRISTLSTSTAQQIQTIPTPTLAGNAMTIPAPSTNFSLDFRSTTLGSGAVTTVSGAPAAITLPSSATLGGASGVQTDIALIVMNNGGTLEYAVCNLAGGIDLTESRLISTSAISSSSTSATTIYSNSARSNLAFRVVAIISSTQATAGTWVTAPSLIQGFGGTALTGFSNFKFSTSQATNGTNTYDFTGIPGAAKRIVLCLVDVSTNGTSPAMVQIGSGSILSTGYLGATSVFVNGVGGSAANNTSGAPIDVAGTNTVGGTASRHGTIVFTRVTGNTWLINGVVGYSHGAMTSNISFSNSTLAGPLDRIRLTTVSGADNFDGGTANITIEF